MITLRDSYGRTLRTNNGATFTLYVLRTPTGRYVTTDNGALRWWLSWFDADTERRRSGGTIEKRIAIANPTRGE